MAEGITKQQQWQTLYGYILGNQASWVADVGLKAGLFAAIAGAGPDGIGEGDLAGALAFDARYVRVWCRAAYAYALLDWDEASAYRLVPHMETLLLDPNDPQSQVAGSSSTPPSTRISWPSPSPCERAGSVTGASTTRGSWKR